MKQTSNLLRGFCLSIFLIVFLDSFFVPYIRYGSGIPALPGGRNLYNSLSIPDFMGSSAVNNGGAAAIGAAMLVIALVVCVLLIISGLATADERLPPRLALTAAIMGFLSFALHVIMYFWLADVRFSILGGIAEGVIDARFGYGYYLNIILLIAAAILSICLYSVSSRVAVVRTMPGTASALQEKTPLTQETDGVIIGKAGMYRYATFRIKNGEELIIGRDAAMSHIIVDTGAEKVSRKHCSIVYDSRGRRYYITDYSSNGTYTEDGTQLQNMVLTPLSCGTTIYLGNRNNSFLLN